MNSREIKFRAWHENLEQMFQVTSVSWANGETFEVGLAKDGRAFGERDVLACPLMQFTGLKDRNGVEIYEGDILRNSVEITKRKTVGGSVTLTFTGKYRTMVAPVRWNDHWGQWDILPEGEHTRCYLEVIGNIYEHPDLLTAEAAA